MQYVTRTAYRCVCACVVCVMPGTHCRTFKVPDFLSGTLHIVIYVTLHESGTVIISLWLHINEWSPTRDNTLQDFTLMRSRRDI